MESLTLKGKPSQPIKFKERHSNCLFFGSSLQFIIAFRKQTRKTNGIPFVFELIYKKKSFTVFKAAKSKKVSCLYTSSCKLKVKSIYTHLLQNYRLASFISFIFFFNFSIFKFIELISNNTVFINLTYKLLFSFT